ncbi:unnamed protein product [Caenorhabditis sp. 36 PRJEB53466]|nr:unnamed protein product [Caenorhabditis sp. 36 PRJEB53466]
MPEKELELLLNPPQEVFNQLIDKSAASDGWAHQPYDYQFWRQNFAGFWFFAIVEKDTQNLVVGACLARWDQKNGGRPLFSIGLYYCVEEYRGDGHGSTIFKAVMDIIGDSDACLTGSVDMVEKYAKSYGFDKMQPYWYYHSTIRMSDLRIPTEIANDVITKNWREVDENALEAYDLTICPRDRKTIMRSWFEMDQVYTRVAFDEKGTIVGYGTIRVVNLNRLCACPFYAENLMVAERLLSDILSEIPNVTSYENLFFWHPEINENATKLFKQFSKDGRFTMEKDFKTQFRNTLIIVTPDEKVYSVADSTHQFV